MIIRAGAAFLLFISTSCIRAQSNCNQTINQDPAAAAQHLANKAERFATDADAGAKAPAADALQADQAVTYATNRYNNDPNPENKAIVDAAVLVDRSTTAEASIRQAEATVADQYYQSAQEAADKAQAAVDDDDNTSAQGFAQQALSAANNGNFMAYLATTETVTAQDGTPTDYYCPGNAPQNVQDC